MRRWISMCAAVAAVLVVATPAGAHFYQRNPPVACSNSGYWTPFINCDGAINNGEAVLAAERVLARSHVYTAKYQTLNCWCFVSKRINASAACVRLIYPDELYEPRKYSHISVVDEDGYLAASGGKPIWVTQHYGDDVPAACR